MLDRLDFMNCPCCSGHEAISVDAAAALEDAIREHLALSLSEHVRAELMNIRNVIVNSREPRIEPATPEESWLDA